MSSKQLAHTVMDGKQVDFHLTGGMVVSGYLAGMDDYHWMVIDPQGKVSLVHKGSAILVQPWTRETYSTEVAKTDLEAVIQPFRKWVGRHFFGRSAATVTTTSTEG